MGIEDELLNLKKRIDENVRKQSEAKIKLELLMKRLQEEFGCETMDEGEEYLKELEEAKKRLQIEIENDIIKLKNELEI